MPTPLLQLLPFDQVARIAQAGDNTAIATRRLEGGTGIVLGDQTLTISGTVLEGHRFAVCPTRAGAPLVSWGLPFGLALRDLRPGEYLCNQKILHALRARRLNLVLPAKPNFHDFRLPVQLDESFFHPGSQVQAIDDSLGFEGFARAGRGVGTRNFLVLLGTSSRTGAFVRALADRFSGVGREFAQVDGVVPVAHTEGGGNTVPHNRDLVLRTLAGFLSHPNVGAVLCVDSGTEPINNRVLQNYLAEHAYPLDRLPHHFLTIDAGYEAAFQTGEAIVRRWLPQVNDARRTVQPISALKVALQCGGSDAFSGVSANPLLGILSREVVARSGAANLAETSELIGAESYILQHVRDLATARKFLATTTRFQEWASWHGHSAEGNPSGGNMLRGLYNISIKSIGAARKKDPAVRLDHVIEYSGPMRAGGFYFMDSPGNDLESIAGQVASGCNMILFATGNGSITNFPFVPTIKVMTTTGRFELVRNEMDFNAGRYLDGEPLEALGEEALALLLRIASGQKSRGELAGHSQVQIWREWRQAGPRGSETNALQETTSRPRPARPSSALQLPKALEAALSEPVASGHTGLVLPTSLCSGQVAVQIAQLLTRDLAGRALGSQELRRVVALPHTEGCGNSAGQGEQLFMRTLANYLVHPFVGRALLLEHGCEKTHNDAFRLLLEELSIPADKLGWASIQLDGGIDRVTRKVSRWFQEGPSLEMRTSSLSVGFWSDGCPEAIWDAVSAALDAVVRLGGSAIVPESGYGSGTRLEHGARPTEPGWHVMGCPTNDGVEILTGLGAAGCTVLLTYSDLQLLPGHPLVPTIRMGGGASSQKVGKEDWDISLHPGEPADTNALEILNIIARVHREQFTPQNLRLGHTAFQITRGTTGISL